MQYALIRRDASVEIMYLCHPAASVEAELAKWTEEHRADIVQVKAVDQLPDHEHRDAWVWDGQRVVVDMTRLGGIEAMERHRQQQDREAPARKAAPEPPVLADLRPALEAIAHLSQRIAELEARPDQAIQTAYDPPDLKPLAEAVLALGRRVETVERDLSGVPVVVAELFQQARAEEERGT